MSRFHFIAGMFLFAVLVLPNAATAQISNQPFSFGSPSTGVGMSVAGKQAIINKKLFGSTPSVLLKSDDGRLLGLSNGPGSLPIVTSPGGEILAGYRGRRSYFGGDAWSAGTFNAFFAGARNGDSSTVLASSSGASIDSWTGPVLSGSGSAYGSGNSVDQWTDMVYW